MHGITLLHTHPDRVIFHDFSQILFRFRLLLESKFLFCEKLSLYYNVSNYNSLFLFFFFLLKYFYILILLIRNSFTKKNFVKRMKVGGLEKKRVNLMNMEWNEIFNYSSFALKNTGYV